MTTEAVRALSSSLRLPSRPSALRQPLPLFPVIRTAPQQQEQQQQQQRIASFSLSFHELQALAQLELELPSAGPLFKNERRLMGSVHATGRAAVPVRVYLLSDGALIAEQGVADVEFVELERFIREGDTLLLSTSNTRLTIAEPSLSSPDLSAWTSLLPPTTPKPTLAPPLPPWTPNSVLATCEACQMVKFGTFQRVHHCRACGKGICRNCSRFERVGGVRVCVDCTEVGSVGCES